MRKYILISSLAVGAIFSNTSCTKCSICHDGIMAGEELCSRNKKERDVFEAACDDAGGYVRM